MTADLPQTPIESLLAEREWVRELARSLVSDANEADDVEQQTWLAAATRPPGDLSSPRAWLGTVLRNFVRLSARRDGRRRMRELASARSEAVASSADMVARAEAHRRVVEAVMTLAEPYRSTVLARYFDDLPPREIAKRMDVPVETVKTRLKRGLAELRARLDAEYGGDGKAWGIALLPLGWKGGVIVNGTTKVAIAAALLVAAGVGALMWPRRVVVAPVEPPVEVAAVPAPAPKPVPDPPKPAAPATSMAVVYGEVWQRGPERPAAGVSVRLTTEGGPDLAVVADARGRFRFEALPARSRGVVRVALDKSVAEPVAVAPLLAGETRFVGVMWLSPAISADIVVTSVDGKPLAGAHAAAFQRPELSNHRSIIGTAWFDEDSASATWRDARDPAASATTDAAGRAVLGGLVAGNWHFLATADGYAAESRVEAVAVGRTTTVRLSLVPGFELAGRVEDRGGKPVAGLFVMAFAGERLEPNVVETIPRTTTGADGRFALKGLAEGRTVLWVARAGRAPVPASDVRVPTTSPVRIVLGGAGMQGTVRDAATGAVVAGARVRAYVGLGGPIAWLDAVTDEAGAYDMEFLRSRAIIDVVRVEGFSVVESHLPPGSRLIGSAYDITGDTKVRLDLTVRGDVGIRGRVTHAGEPVRGAAVRAFTMPSGVVTLADTWTDGDGRYEIRGLNGLLAIVRVVAPPYAQPGFPHSDVISYLRSGKLPPRWGVQVPEGGGARVDVELVDGAEVAGRVVDPADRPIEGAELVMGDSVILSAADGSFAFHGVDSEASNGVTASRDGFIDAVVGLDPLPLTIRMKPCRLVRGTVRATDGVLELAWVEYAPKYGAAENGALAPPIDWGKARRAPVADDGTFTFGPTFAFSRIAVRAGSRGHGPTAPVDVVLDGAEAPPELSIDLAPSMALRGHVVAEDGSPIAGARVELDRAKIDRWDDEGRAVALKIDAVTDAAGRFEIASATSGMHKLLVVTDGFAGAIVDADGSADEVVIRLTRVMEIAGVVLRSDGAPFAGTSVTFFPRGATEPSAWSGPNWYATVRADGSFRAAAMPPGVYWARVSPAYLNVSFEPARFEDIAAGTTDAKFVVDTTRSISGRVAGGDGAPLADVEIWFRQDSDPPNRMSAIARTASDGRFEVSGLKGTKYAASVRPPQASNAGVFCLGKRYLATKVEGLVPGASGIEIVLPLGAEIEGVLLAADGKPVVGRAVVPERLANPAAGEVSDGEKPGALTDDAGRFVVTGLSPGRYRLVAVTSWGLSSTPVVGGEDVEAGARGLRVSLPGTSSIAGRVVDETDAPFAGVTVVAAGADGVRFAAATTADGAFEIQGVPAFGKFEVSATLNKRLPIRVLDVAPGATGVKLRLVRGLPASGRLLGADGKPVTPATLVFRTEHGEIEASAYADDNGRFVVTNLLPGEYRVEQMTSKGGEFVYLSWGTIHAGDEGVELRRVE
jgi:RNA polymerase sigma-70 factor (ECF subfamily)